MTTNIGLENAVENFKKALDATKNRTERTMITKKSVTLLSVNRAMAQKRGYK